MSEIVYDLCVIGAGMFGSAAARHASANLSIKVCLVGAAEPTVDELPNREILGSHYDESRIVRLLDESPPCTVMTQHSMGRYRELERLSGIQFYEPVGCLFTGPKDGGFIRTCLDSGALARVPVVEMAGDGETFKRRFPYMKLQSDEFAFLDDSGAGLISPRKLVAAQKRVARLQGCHIVESVVCGTETLSDGIHVVKTESKGEIRAKRLLIATGCFVNLKGLGVLKPLVVRRLRETLVFLKVPEDEVQRLGSMPTVISMRGSSEGVYFFPPIQYPDGQHYLKFGKVRLQEGPDDYLESLQEIHDWFISEGGKEIDAYIQFMSQLIPGQHYLKFGKVRLQEGPDDYLESLQEIHDWFLSEGGKEIDAYIQLMSELIPGLRFSEVRKKTCATCNTPSALPYIDRVSPTVSVAVGGNGKGARFSDEVGRIAAHLCLTGKWDSELEKALFEAVFQ